MFESLRMRNDLVDNKPPTVQRVLTCVKTTINT